MMATLKVADYLSCWNGIQSSSGWRPKFQS